LLSGLVFDARDGSTMRQHLDVVNRGPDRGKRRRFLVSMRARNHERDANRTMMPYGILEAAILRFVYELKPADLAGGEREQGEARLQALDGRIAELQGLIGKTTAALDAAGGKIDGLLKKVVDWDAELKDAKRDRDELAGRLETDASAALADAQTALCQLRDATDKDRGEVRARLKARIREVVESVWLLVWGVDPLIRAAEVQVNLRGGRTRALLLAWRRGGRYSGLATGIGSLVGKPGKDAHLADKRLANYRTDIWTQEFFQRHQNNMAPAIKQVVDAEIAARKALAMADRRLGTDTLAEYLAETLDGRRPPVHPGRPRKHPAK
jgi:hypothetical protein